MRLKKSDEAASSNFTTQIQTITAQRNSWVRELQALRDEVWQKALKYQWDPEVGEIYRRYLQQLNQLLRNNHENL